MLSALERRLLATSLSPLQSNEENLTLDDAELEQALVAIEEGRYLDALRSPASAALLAAPSAGCSSEEYFGTLAARAEAIWTASESDTTAASHLFLTGVAAMYAFSQTNLTGPVWKGPANPWETATWSEPAPEPHVPGQALAPRAKEVAEDRWARLQLQEDGEDVVGRYDHIQYLLVARTLIAMPLMQLGDREAYAQGQVASLSAAAQPGLALHPTLALWAFRTLLTQQRMLEGPSMTLRACLRALQPIVGALKRRHADLKGAVSAALQVELSLMEHSYTYVDLAKGHLDASCKEAQLHFEITGKMGLRTKHQVDAKPQLIVQTHAQADRETAELSGDEDLWLMEAPPVDTSSLPADAEGGVDIVQQEIRGITDESDVLLLPRMQDGSLPAILGSVEQSILLGHSVHVKKGTAADELQPWEMAPYVETVLAQPKSRFLLQLAARLFRARHERTRNRTRERSLLTMEQLGEAIMGPRGPAVPVRMRYAFTVWFPLLPALRKEIGEVMLGMGLVGAAMDIFERLELWDSLITCYRLLQKKVQAEDLVQKRLLEEPDEPRLWCALGDLTLNEDHYLTAWERSKHRSTRAQRSLAYAAHRKGEYARSAGHWEKALAINPLHPIGWFSMGHCYIKLQDYEKGLRAFTRCCQLEYDNGEAWNNLAAILMQLKRFKEGFNALGEAIKFKRDSWQTWENYAQCAVEARQFQQACRSLIRVLDISHGSKLHMETLQKLAANYERLFKIVQDDKAAAADEATAAARGCAAGAPAPAAAAPPSSDAFDFDFPAEMNLDSDEDEEAAGPLVNAAEALSRAVAGEEEGLDARGRARLLESFGNLLLEVLKKGANGMATNSDLWEAFGRYYRARGERVSEKECQLKRVRGLQGGQWMSDEPSFTAFASASLDLSRCCVVLAEGPGGRKGELAAARMHLRSVLKQSEDKYGETEAYLEMTKMLNQVQELEEAASVQ